MIRVVTSFSPDGFDTYAKNMLESVIQHWKNDLCLIAYHHDFPEDKIKELPQSPLIEYRNLNDVEDMLNYREAMKNHDGTMGGKTEYNWRLDAIKWCHKVYAMTDLSLEISEKEVKGGWLIWLDADTVTTKPLSEEKLLEFLNPKAEISHLGRTATDYSETSFIGFNLNFQAPHLLLADLRGCYDTHEVVSYREWHDGFIFERLLNMYTAHGMRVQNLTPNVKGLNAFGVSPLADYMEHYKGNLKHGLSDTDVSKDIVLPRYRQLADLVRTYATNEIVEVGTWNGGRAIEMALAAFEKTDNVHYIGFDLFEEATDEIDLYEFNTKPHNTMAAVTKRFKEFQDKMAEQGKTFSFELYKGDSKETLTKFDRRKNITFAYIDGGHSDDTLASDYENLKNVPVLVFNNFYTKDVDNNLIDESYHSVNRLIHDKFKDKRCTVLPSQDVLIYNKQKAGITHLAVTLNDEDLPPIPDDLRRAPIIVQPRDSVPQEHITTNIKANLDIIKDWSLVKACDINKEHLLLVSAGPSLDIAKIKKDIKYYGAKVVCVKHAYPILMKAGIIPYACVILDPREITGTSTHNVVRSTLFEDINPRTMFFVASMTDPSVTKTLLKKTDKVYGWHAYSQSLQENVRTVDNPNGEIKLAPETTYVTGGTSAAMRAIGLFHILGFRNFIFHGYDCSFIDEPTEEEKKEKIRNENPKFIQVELNGNTFWTTGELLAMAQDCEKLFDDPKIDFNLLFRDNENTLVGAIYRDSSRNFYRDYRNIINNLKPTKG